MASRTDWTKEEIKSNLQTADVWVWRAIAAIYKFQTDAEQNAGMTQEDNGVGFNGPDSVILSSFARQINKWEQEQQFPTPLSPRQMDIALTKILKYSGQLAKIANGEV